jgi:hypothetical protein
MEVVYEIRIEAEPKSKVYKDLIDYAADRSNALMLIARYDFTVISEFQPAKEDIFENKKQYLEYLSAIKRMETEAITNARIFKERTEPFLQNLQPYLIKKRHTPTEWPSTKVFYDGDNSLIDINVYRVCEGIKEFIYLKDAMDIQALQKINLSFTVTEHKVNDNLLFYENY